MVASPDDLKYFLEAANALNFSRASERLGISQPSLSLAIKGIYLAGSAHKCLPRFRSSTI